jgi:molybdopterin-binding protein
VGPGGEDPRRAGRVKPACGFRGRSRGYEAARRDDLGSERFPGVVRSVELEGLPARAEIDVTAPARVVAISRRESPEQLRLEPGVGAAGVVNATSVMVER